MSKDGYLPPGVEEWMIPGNRPEDALWERVLEDKCNEEACRCFTVCKLVEKGDEHLCKRLDRIMTSIQNGDDKADEIYERERDKQMGL